MEYLSLIPAGEQFVTFSRQSASIRRVLKECIARCIQSDLYSTTGEVQALHGGCESPPCRVLPELPWGAADATIHAITLLSGHTGAY